jgi:N-methylhydantoinase A/oxoprolinase/acetone carboxylase beta subunit
VAVEAVQGEGAKVVVATSALSVDDNSAEETMRRAANAVGIPVTCGHEISKLYGLTVRTRTAVINASILPKMIDTAAMTESSVREAGIVAPLMIMRGDGGVMDIHEMRRRPAMTMLSGPAASVAGALMHLKVSDGIYFEVGGTSTNIGVIRNGKPTVKYARVGGHETYVSSLDVRVLGIAGGSMVRAKDGKLVDVGPRSAHIAGLPYAAFAEPAQFDGATVEFIRPHAGDPDDYVAIRCRDGKRYALTNTCAANVLGYAKPGLHASGNPQAAKAAMAPFAAFLGGSVEEAARQVLDCASAKVVPVVEQLIAEYGLDPDQVILIGEGGGAGALIPFTAERMKLRHTISKDAEVISSIGVALALVREVVERVIPNPQPDDLRAIRREAFDAVVRLGAAAETVDVAIEIDPHTQRVRATAMGASEMRTRSDIVAIDERAAREIAATSMAVPAEIVQMVAATDRMRIFQASIADRRPVRAVDLEGTIRLQRSDARVITSSVQQGLESLKQFWTDTQSEDADGMLAPDMFAVMGAHIVDLSGIVSLDQALAVTRAEFEGLAADVSVILVSSAGLRR